MTEKAEWESHWEREYPNTARMAGEEERAGHVTFSFAAEQVRDAFADGWDARAATPPPKPGVVTREHRLAAFQAVTPGVDIGLVETWLNDGDDKGHGVAASRVAQAIADAEIRGAAAMTSTKIETAEEFARRIGGPEYEWSITPAIAAIKSRDSAIAADAELRGRLAAFEQVSKELTAWAAQHVNAGWPEVERTLLEAANTYAEKAKYCAGRSDG